MSTDTGTGTGTDARPLDSGSRVLSAFASARAIALGGVALLMTSYGTVLFHLVDVSGDPTQFLALVAITLGVATVLSAVLRVYSAVLVGAAALAAGHGLYVGESPE